MSHVQLQTMIVALLFAGLAFADEPTLNPPDDAKKVEGIWSGAWGGGDRDGVVFQPVLAEMVIQGDKVELSGFRNADRFSGTIRVVGATRQLRMTSKNGDPPITKVLDYTYEIKGDTLTLIDSDKIPVQLHKQRVESNPLANARVELVAATRINEAGDLLVTEFTVLQAGSGPIHYQPENRSLKTAQATVLVLQEAGLKKVTVDEARGLIRKSTPVVVAYRNDDQLPLQNHGLWKNLGSPQPDSEAVWQTYSRILRPGTVIFILSSRENIPQP